MAGSERPMKAREFLFASEERAMASLPREFPRPERKVMWTILQLHYGNPDVHFELQPHVGRGMVELGLHFEGPAEANDACARTLAARTAELMPALGEGWELEEWTASWRRLHRVYRFEKLTVGLSDAVGDELAKALTTLHPVLDTEELRDLAATPRPRTAPPGKPRQWRKRKG